MPCPRATSNVSLDQVNIELIDGFTEMNFGPLLRIRLPHLTCSSLDDVSGVGALALSPIRV